MKEIIKNIRLYLNLSQEEFASKLAVSFQTVNRWENGRAVPNKMAQNNIYNFCIENNVPVYEMTIQRIENESKTLKHNKYFYISLILLNIPLDDVYYLAKSH